MEVYILRTPLKVRRLIQLVLHSSVLSGELPEVDPPMLGTNAASMLNR